MANLSSEGKQVVAQGSLEYNGQTIAYVVSKGNEIYSIEVSFVKGEKQNNKENNLEFKFEKKEDGKFYLNKKDALYLHKVFIEKNDSQLSLNLAKDEKTIAKSYLDEKNNVGFIFEDKIISFLSGSTIYINSLSEQLGFVEGIKLKTLISKFITSFEKQMSK